MSVSGPAEPDDRGDFTTHGSREKPQSARHGRYEGVAVDLVQQVGCLLEPFATQRRIVCPGTVDIVQFGERKGRVLSEGNVVEAEGDAEELS